MGCNKNEINGYIRLHPPPKKSINKKHQQCHLCLLQFTAPPLTSTGTHQQSVSWRSMINFAYEAKCQGKAEDAISLHANKTTKWWQRS